MWRKIIWVIAIKGIESIDWDAIINRVLVRMAELVKVKLGVTVNLADLNVKDVQGIIEEILSDVLGIDVDINKDGKIGDNV